MTSRVDFATMEKIDVYIEDAAHAEVMRKKIILRLTNVTKRLMPHTHSPEESAHFNEINQDAVDLCDVLEMAFLHGVKIAEFGGALPSWKLLEKFENAAPVCIPLRNSVGAIASVGSLKSAVGRTRGWIRQILNAKCVEECMQYIITQHGRALVEFYQPGALLCHSGDANILMNVLRCLKVVKFNFKVGDADSLNDVPMWLSAAATAARPPMPIPPRSAKQISASSSSNNSNSNSSGGLFNSFLSSFLSKAGTAANEATDFISNTIEKTATELAANAMQAEAARAGNNRAGRQVVPDASTARNRPLVGTTFFQSTSLCDLLLDEKRCTHANLNPLLGVPTQATRLINFLLNYVSTPNLFRARSTPAALEAVHHAVEDEKNLPSSADAAAVAKVLIDWLNQLPEPLFGFQHYDAIIACQEIENKEARIRNLAVLLLDSPWYCKPLMSKIMTLLNECLKPENIASNKLNSWAVAVMCSPFLLRSEQQQKMRVRRTFLGLTPEEQEEDDQVQMAAAAAGSGVVEFIITHSSSVLSRVRAELAVEHSTLVAKCQHIRVLQEQVVDILNVKRSVESTGMDRHTQTLVISLFKALGDAENLISLTAPSKISFAASQGQQQEEENVSSSVSASAKDDDILNISAVLASERWDICGFSTNSRDSRSDSVSDHDSSPLRDFQGSGGALALQCVVGFFIRYRPKAAAVVSDFAQNRHKFCTFPQTVVRLVHFVAEVLELSPNSASRSNSTCCANDGRSTGGDRNEGASSMEDLAKLPCWALLGQDMCFFETFDLAMLTFEDAWKSLTDVQEQLATTETYALACYKVRSVLFEIIGKRPTTLDGMWELWMARRVKDQEFYINKMQQQRKVTSSAPSPVHIESNVNTNAIVENAASKRLASKKVQQQAFPVKSNFTLVDEDDDDVYNNDIGDNDDEVAVFKASGADSNQGINSKTVSAATATHRGENKEGLYCHGHDDSTHHAATEEHHDFHVHAHSQPPPAATGLHTVLRSGAKASVVTDNAHEDKYSDEAAWTASAVEQAEREMNSVMTKSVSGIATKVIGGSNILSAKHISALEAALPSTHQCQDWQLLYRMSLHGSNVSTLLHKAKGYSNSLLVVRDNNDVIFGALITDQLKVGEKEKYYGNGTTAVWSFNTSALKMYNWSYKNSYFVLSGKDMLAVGGGGNFAVYLDSDLNNGSSGKCDTFSSPCLASSESFICHACELFGFVAAAI